MKKKNNNAKWNRIMALLLSGVMVLGSAPTGVLAAEPEMAAELEAAEPDAAVEPEVEEVQVEEAESEEVVVGEGEDIANPETSIPTEEHKTNVSVKFAETELYLIPGNEVELPEIEITPANVQNLTVEYLSDNENIVGLVYKESVWYAWARNVGETEIKVNIKDDSNDIIASATCKVTVDQSIQIENLVLNEGEEKELKGNVVYSKDEKKELKNAWNENFECKYSDNDIASVYIDEDGNIKVKANKAGQTTITIKQIGNSYITGTFDITVNHVYKQPKFEWSEDEEGGRKCKVEFVCDSCKEGIKVIDAKVTTKHQDATCTQVPGTCYIASISLDGKEYSDEQFVQTDPNAKPTGHRFLKAVPEKAATCKTKGNLAYYLCEKCGGHFKDAKGKELYKENGWVIEEKPHTFKFEKKTEATATKEGVRTYTCKVCKKKVTYKIPRTAFTYKLGTNSKCIVSKVSDFKSIQLPTSSAYSTTKKAFTLNTKTWTLSPTRNAYKYYKSMKSFIPLTVTTKDGKKSTVKVNFQFPDPEVKITRTYETQAGRGVYRYTFQYDIPGAKKIDVRLNTKSTRINNDFKNDFKNYISKPKSDKESYIRVWKSYVDSVGKNGMKFQITAYYGTHKSRTITIAK